MAAFPSCHNAKKTTRRTNKRSNCGAGHTLHILYSYPVCCYSYSMYFLISCIYAPAHCYLHAPTPESLKQPASPSFMLLYCPNVLGITVHFDRRIVANHSVERNAYPIWAGLARSVAELGVGGGGGLYGRVYADVSTSDIRGSLCDG